MEPGRTVLVVEDEMLVSLMLVEAFSELGFAALSAARGEDAIALLEQVETVDVLITDLDLPGAISGREVAQHARELHPDIAIVFASGRSDRGGENLMLPGTRFVAKPYSAADVLAAVASLAAQAKPHRRARR
jgi:CheY-like chemotaxis protein